MNNYLAVTTDQGVYWEQLDVFFKEVFKKLFERKGDFGNFSREHGNTDPPDAFNYESRQCIYG